MAGQEFLSWYWGWNGDGHSIHKKYNFQFHQLYFANPEVPPGRDRQSSRFLFMDADMLVRTNLNDVFSYEISAGIL